MLATKDLPQTASIGNCGHDVCFSELVEQTPCAVYAIDTEGRLTYFNRAAAQLAGREPQIGSDRWCVTWKLYRPDGSFLPHDKCLMAVALKELRNIRGAEAIVERPDGSRIWVEPYPTILYGSDGQVKGAVNVLIDITARKRAAEALAEVDRRKNEFLAQLGHELRNPLAAMRNALAAVLRPAENRMPERERTLLSIADRQLDHITRLVDDLLEISRINFGKIELKRQSVDLAEILRQAIETVRPKIDRCGHTLKVELPSQPLYLDADPVRLAQVFINLLRNAVEFTENGGVIQLTGDWRRDTAIITVRDSGVGISREMLPRVFDMFAQEENTQGRMQSGLGIGLALVKDIVELHGGRVEAHSDGVGLGSEFIVHLPGAAQRKTKELNVGQTPVQTGAAPRVLVIDDDHDVADSLAILLETMGAESRVAYGGAEGLKTLIEFHPGLVFLDISMAEMDGYEAARRIRAVPKERCHVKLVALTGWGQDQDQDRGRARDAGFDGHMTKPPSIEELETFLAMDRAVGDRGG